ncbi:type I-B CRISPR-associated protein Cas8b1/Cst1 [Methanobrevibacter millerae]|uniref:CRISPR-associated protein, Cst1 family n=1 Tax=Methanobrevibacter millerae TaxID=230361 RepID=A0A1G5VH43_9EURY|nr:type I-B CRISPR-associated protein Cas8b1/Cst1 [Methanobrevibacter millerae]SDA45192.1 CRISPR-associated protein, Cst1 family [Methanobrevibacter millerae]
MSKCLDIKITGNPFVDSGIYALKTRLEKDIPEITVEDLKSESKEISKLYTKDSWKRNMHSIFPNSVLVNPASTNKTNLRELYLKNLNELTDSIEPVQDSGSCMGCGMRDAKNVFAKDSVPLTGSKSLTNYFSFANPGADYCPACALLMQFFPLTLYRCGGRMILLHSNSPKVMEFWARKAIEDIDLQISSGESSGCYNKGITRPTNAIFNIISQIIKSGRHWRGENPSFNFYYFTNYNQGPELDIFTLPTSVFTFLTEIPPDDWKNWNFIVKKAYRFVKWENVENKKDYENNPNTVFNNLLEGKSILKSFYTTRFKRTFCTWKLVESYMKEVRNMDKKRIEVIKDVGDRLSRYIKNNDRIKTLNNLEQASNYNTFRNVLRKILKNKINNGDNELLFTFDEYVISLFPQGNTTWRETQDLLLFRIYENLNEWLIENKYVENKTEDELLEED